MNTTIEKPYAENLLRSVLSGHKKIYGVLDFTRHDRRIVVLGVIQGTKEVGVTDLTAPVAKIIGRKLDKKGRLIINSFDNIEAVALELSGALGFNIEGIRL